MKPGISAKNTKGPEAEEGLLNGHSFEDIYKLLDKLYAGWAMSAVVDEERNERLRTLILVDELKQYFEHIEKNNKGIPGLL